MKPTSTVLYMCIVLKMGRLQSAIYDLHRQKGRKDDMDIH